MLDEQTAAELARWIEDASGASVVFVFTETPGNGLSTTIKNLLQPYEAIFVSNGQRGLNMFLRDVASSAVAVTGRKKVIVLDPMDALFSDPGTSQELGEFVRSSAHPLVPIICAGFRQRSSKARAEELFKKKPFVVTHIVFPPVVPTVAASALEKATGCDLDTCLRAYTASQHDYQSALQALTVALEDGCKDEVCDGADAVCRVLFEQPGLRASMDLLDGDVSMVSMGVHENFANMCECDDVYADVADAFSLGDVVEESMYGKQRWELYDVYASLVVGVAAVLIPAQEPKPVSKFGTVWSRSNNQRAKQKMLLSLLNRVAETGSRSMTCTVDVACIREMLSCWVGGKKYAELAEFLAGMKLEPGDALMIMRLFKGKYTQTDHGKVRNAFASQQQ